MVFKSILFAKWQHYLGTDCMLCVVGSQFYHNLAATVSAEACAL